MPCLTVPALPIALAAPSGCCAAAIGMRLTYSGFSGPIGTFINRAVNSPPNSIKVSGSYPASLTWDLPLAGGVVIHPSQQNLVDYYGNINGGGSAQSLTQSWRADVAALGGGLFSIKIGAHPNSAQWAFGYVASCPLDGSVSAGSRPVTISTFGFEEAFVTGGTFSLAPIYP